MVEQGGRDRVAELERELRQVKGLMRGIRRRSQRTVGGLPLWEVALGPDLERGEQRGHARAVFALGDVATGWFASGGVAMGGVVLGGVAVGLVPIGGLALGGLALGGAAVGLAAIGGGAVGLVAVGGAALGYYACGGAAFGEFVLGATRQDPEAIRFFGEWLPRWLVPAGLRGLLGR